MKERNAALEKTERKHFSINCNKHCFQKLHVDVQAEESDLKTSVPKGEFDQNEDTFSVYIDELEHYFNENCQKPHT